MESNELRINNYVNRKYFNPHPKNPDWQLEYCRISLIAENTVNVKIKGNSKLRFSINSDLISPIPLTEQWLIKFGFEKRGMSYILSSGYGTFVINKWADGKLMFTNIVLVNSFELKYVHQLQNLYFALMGEELI